MTGSLPSEKLRAVAALIAAYAIALQAVFTTLAPMQVQADGTIAVYCSGAALAAGSDDPDEPAPATGKLRCVFCGACAAGTALLPGSQDNAYAPTVASPVSLRTAPDERAAAFHLSDGPARAPPHFV